LHLRETARIGNSLLNRLEVRLGRSAIRAWPVEVTLEPTNRCNSRCIICLPYRRDPRLAPPPQGFLAEETFLRVEPLLHRVRRVLLTGCGEPLLHPRFLEIARRVKERGPYVYLFTNGTLIDETCAAGIVREGLDMISFSLGGATARTAERVRGFSFEEAVSGLERLARARASAGSATPVIEFNIVAMNSVLPELRELVDLAHRHGVARITVPQLLVHSPETADESIFSNPDATRLLKEAGDYAHRKGLELAVWHFPLHSGRCTAPWRNLFVAFNGDVLSCAAERYIMGNVLEEPALKIWRSQRFRELRRLLWTSPETVCPACPDWTGKEKDYLQAVPHDRRAAGTFDAEGRPRGGPRKGWTGNEPAAAEGRDDV
jgi:MoaA/NifB/PqqE/SkfB family radical SAM enzyme